MPGELKIWDEALAGIRFVEIRRAIIEHAKRVDYFPKPSEIISIIDEGRSLDAARRDADKTAALLADMRRAREDSAGFLDSAEGRELKGRLEKIDRTVALKADNFAGAAARIMGEKTRMPAPIETWTPEQLAERKAAAKRVLNGS